MCLGVGRWEQETNLLFFTLAAGAPPLATLIAACRRDGVAIGGGGNRVRLVTHLGVDAAAADHLITSLSTHLGAAALANTTVAVTSAEVTTATAAKL